VFAPDAHTWPQVKDAMQHLSGALVFA
jgi:hypothetical protein